LATFLLEIGSEELPADFVRIALPQLERLVQNDLAAQRLPFSALQLLGGPRRLAVLIEGLPARQEDLKEERKGPPAGQAFADGLPTTAAIGFANRCGIDPASLEVRDTPRGPFVFATVLQAGLATAEVLPSLVPGWISGLQGRRFMRWGNGDSRFPRPVRWLVALLDGEVLPVALADADPPLQADRISRGHRLVTPLVPLATAADYRSSLAAAGVTVDRRERAEAIRGAVETMARRLEATPDLPQGLFDELVDLVEAPLPIEGQIAPEALALPPEVLCTVMRSHQRYVPFYRAGASVDPLALESGEVLLPRFLCIGNGRAEASEQVRQGNERVLRARLADAAFFIASDRAMASIDRREQLARVTFAEGLGSLRDRVERLEWCTDVWLQALVLDGEEADHARRAAHLCKHDLVSQMVGEFPELQGVMGGKYLLAEGEPRQVALAVQEHYRPRGAGDGLPTSAAGAVVALAERLELMLSIFARGERPSGSSDPYALRRAGNGLLQILWDRGWRPDLQAILRRGGQHWTATVTGSPEDAATLIGDLEDFLRQRLVSLLEEAGHDPDIVQALVGPGLPLQRILGDPKDVLERAELLTALRRSGRLSEVQAVVQRAARLAGQADLPEGVMGPAGLIDPDRFEKPSEAAMLQVLERLEPLARPSGGRSYGALAEALAESAATLAGFFDGEGSVLVMCDDRAVRANRLRLLAILRLQASVLADFTALAG
jgi:glycyl-tRNA synthetase beta chain